MFYLKVVWDWQLRPGIRLIAILSGYAHLMTDQIDCLCKASLN